MKNKKKFGAGFLSWREKKSGMDAEEPALQKEVEEIASWVSSLYLVTLFESMDEAQLKEYVLTRLPPSQYRGTKKAPIKRVYRSQHRGKPVKSSANTRTTNSIMAAVWKFHSEEDDQSRSNRLVDA
ncbi:hypothetical protein SUGI_0569750 [Cryptomeria japonica]|nr:hypothetical protein SUGI_0569750 [Cryptomeria japonica]